MTDGMAESGVLRVGCVLVDLTTVWQGIQIISVMHRGDLQVQHIGK
jgi:hypothetical protein